MKTSKATALLCVLAFTWSAHSAGVRIAVFQADVTPPLGAPLCNGGVMPAKEIVSPLTARGIVILGAEQPIVLCSVDWVGIGGESYDIFRSEIAAAAGTTPERVAVHAVHQHDAPGSNFGCERLLAKHGLEGNMSDPASDRRALANIVKAVKEAVPRALPFTHIGCGKGIVEKVASNRRVMGEDGNVQYIRYGRCSHPPAVAAPEGTIDPYVKLISFWDGDKPIASITYYASHPHSFYGKGGVNWEFVGYARQMREQALPGMAHIHFCGAGGNIAAGKYNDGSPEMRPVLTQRLAEGMRLAWESQQKQPVKAGDIAWKLCPVALPVWLPEPEEELERILRDNSASLRDRRTRARLLCFHRRVRSGHKIPITCLWLGTTRILHMPAELFVEYQLAAQQMAPGNFVAMAAYGDCEPGYIGTAISYKQRGGYETMPFISRTTAEVEQVLMDAMRKVLGK